MKRFILFILCCVWTFVLSAEEYRLQFFDDRDGLSHWRTSHVVQDSTGMVWIASWNGLNRFDGNRFFCFKTKAGDSILTPSDKFRHIKLNEENNLYCVVEDSIFLFNTRTCRFDTLTDTQRAEVKDRLRIRHNPDYRLPTDRHLHLGNLDLQTIQYKYLDKAGNYWLIDDHGLYIAVPAQTRAQRINNKEIRSMQQLSNGEIWVAPRLSHRIDILDNSMHVIRVEDFGAPVYCIYEQKNGTIWVGTKPGGLTEVHLANGKIHHMKTHAQVRNVYDVLEDPDGTLWMATYGFGIWRKASERDFEPLRDTEGMYVRRLLRTDDSTLLAATTAGLLEIHPDSITLHQREAGNPRSLSSNAVMCLAAHKEWLYVGTEGGGLNRIRFAEMQRGNLAFEHITKADGLASDIIYEIVPWDDQTLLLQGNSALTMLRTEQTEMLNFGNFYFNYPADKELIFGEVPPLRLAQGGWLIAPHDGLLWMDSACLQPDTTPVRIAISAVQISNGEMNYAADTLHTITLASDERSLGVWYAAMDYRNCGAVLYRTRLFREGGVEPQWSTASATAEIQIPDLDPGTYYLDICSTNAYQQWQTNQRRLTIIVRPAFLESTIGKVLLLALLVSIIISTTITMLHIRSLRLKRQEALDAYLEIQERMAVLQTQTTPSDVPLPEVMVAGYLNQNEQFIQALTAFMEKNMGNTDIGVEELTAVMGMSRSSLTRKMHELFNLSPKDFLQAARIKHACSLLLQTDLAVKEIAYDCGFSNPQYFATCFKTSTGLSPTEYRSQNKQTLICTSPSQ